MPLQYWGAYKERCTWGCHLGKAMSVLYDRDNSWGGQGWARPNAPHLPEANTRRNFCFCALTSVMSHLFCMYPKILRERMWCVWFGLNLPPCCHASLLYIMGFWHHTHPSKCSKPHASRCQYCNVGFVLFHDVTCSTDSLLSCAYVNTTNLLNVTCTLVSTCVILGRFECSM